MLNKLQIAFEKKEANDATLVILYLWIIDNKIHIHVSNITYKKHLNVCCLFAHQLTYEA